jgi:hypothetical protein
VPPSSSHAYLELGELLAELMVRGFTEDMAKREIERAVKDGVSFDGYPEGGLRLYFPSRPDIPQSAGLDWLRESPTLNFSMSTILAPIRDQESWLGKRGLATCPVWKPVRILILAADVERLWSDHPRALITRAPPPIRPLRGGDNPAISCPAPGQALGEKSTRLDQPHPRPEATPDNATAPPATERIAEATETDAAPIERLAEWIFARHCTTAPPTFEKLCDAAVAEFEGFKKADLRTAYGRVYDTKPHRPPATGWPLRSPYRERWQDKYS